mmetsp:Transcript_352/g.1079  ORF Transcript_352/g.1079 Transcript_352/m.1079 type:complete len:202 (-) Transcript_352:794-1399(-)
MSTTAARNPATLAGIAPGFASSGTVTPAKTSAGTPGPVGPSSARAGASATSPPSASLIETVPSCSMLARCAMVMAVVTAAGSVREIQSGRDFSSLVLMPLSKPCWSLTGCPRLCHHGRGISGPLLLGFCLSITQRGPCWSSSMNVCQGSLASGIGQRDRLRPCRLHRLWGACGFGIAASCIFSHRRLVGRLRRIGWLGLLY